jgi:predicted DNA-binding transcriptional regulator YafY
MTNPANRLITLILLLQRQPNQKAGDLAKKLDVSVRTLHRYMEMLDEMGIPIYAERGPYGGFSLVRGFKMPPLIFTPEEAVAVYLGTGLVKEVWGTLYQEAGQGALAKLDNVLPDEQRSEVAWALRTLVATGMHHADLSSLSPVLEVLRQAISELRQINMVYRGTTSSESLARIVDPFALAYRSGWWYLIGYCQMRKAMRIFRVDRIRDLNLSDQQFKIPKEFNVREYLEREFRDQSQLRARLHFSPEAAHVPLANRAIWESFQELPDGSVDVTILAPDLNWLASIVLSFGILAIVIEPEELRQLVREQAQAITGLYANDRQLSN